MKKLRLNTKNVLAHLTISLIIFTLFFQSTIGPYNKANAQSYTPCKCAIFRLDDITDGSLKIPTGTILDHFITEEKGLTTDIIASELETGALMVRYTVS